MSKGINKASLLGHLGKDPEIRATQGGTIIATFSLATSDRRKDQHGDWQDTTEWHNLVAFNRTAEICRDYLSKGSQVYVEGKIQTRSWEDDATGVKKYRTEILVNELIMLGGAKDGENGRQSAHAQERSVTPNAHGVDIDDDDIPF
jgi:single-strand DNA-binding protein